MPPQGCWKGVYSFFPAVASELCCDRRPETASFSHRAVDVYLRDVAGLSRTSADASADQRAKPGVHLLLRVGAYGDVATSGLSQTRTLTVLHKTLDNYATCTFGELRDFLSS